MVNGINLTLQEKMRLASGRNTWKEQWNMIKGYDVVGDRVHDPEYIGWYIGSPKNEPVNRLEGLYYYGTVLVQINPPWYIVKVHSPHSKAHNKPPELLYCDKPLFVSIYSSLFGREAIYKDIKNNKNFLNVSPNVVMTKVDEAIQKVVPKIV